MKTVSSISRGALAIALAMSSGAVWAQSAPVPAPADSIENGGSEIIVTGTRTTGMKASDSPAPVTILGSDALGRVGQPDLNQALAQQIPTIQAQAFGNDQTAFHPSIKLRGLNPNHTLVLLDGKRRHGTANVVVTNAIWTGGAAPDIGLIPGEMIDHVEVLQDGAAAQYGTDAIAGVINFILKKNDHGGTLNLNAGQYEEGDGKQYDIQGNIGLAPIEDMFLSLTGEYKFHGYSFRGDVDPRVVDTGQNTSANTGNNGGRTILARFPGVTGFKNYPYVNQIFGDGQMKLTNVFYNWGYTGFNNVELYSSGSYSRRVGSTYQNYRLPNVVYGKASAATINTATPCPTGTFCDIPFPTGFAPQEQLRETDYSASGGAKFTFGNTTVDASLTYGRDFDGIYVLHSANAALYYDSSTLTTKGYSPSDFHDGDFTNSQLTGNLDLTHKFDLGLSEPVTLAGGLEWRREEYALKAGDPSSYYTGTGFLGGGVQSFFGYAPANASDNTRRNLSEYLDVTVKPVEQWLVDGAIRHEHYSDFGSTTIYKLTSRFDINDKIAIRGTVSTGFRAPTLAEGFYSGINVSVASLSGIFAPNSAGASALGIGGLKPEKSTNFSLGLVLKPVSRLTMTVDGYMIKIRDRIVQSSGFTGYSNNCKYLPGGYTTGAAAQAAYTAFVAGGGACTGIISPSVLTALANNGVPIQSVITAINGGASGSLAINSFVNGINTKTSGIDFLATYWTPLPGKFGRVDWSLALNYNKTKATKVNPPPANVNQAQPVVDKYALSNLINTTPKFRATFGALWTMGRFEVNLRESYYGNSGFLTTFPTNGNQDVFINTGTAFITDLEVGVKLFKGIKISAGANNIFNKYPNKYPADFRAAQYATSSTAYITKYPVTSPYGVMGGYYYGRIGVKF
ncbi:iron complex outermembrane receptor protein [Sphingomonas vulcanisoli]|uniref:Iron complex outermembrane receptor protein n=1 Tax=Sphingomonas vulcanisoli TaxID=1658060 RepID=A0ABX0TQ00_9SPHN|nr:TonB-dependent receptor [Sphingomonas vulcanisoli]NIJ07158.1 iron complex outermembrane receptor protein [Sphingomonas vulcanisoli]